MDEKHLTPIKAIRAKCLDCCCDSQSEVKNCTIERCPLWPYRMGRNPYRPKLSVEEKERRAAILQENRLRKQGQI